MGCCDSQAIAAILADGSLAVSECMQSDLWDETLEACCSHALLPGVVHSAATRSRLIR